MITQIGKKVCTAVLEPHLGRNTDVTKHVLRCSTDDEIALAPSKIAARATADKRVEQCLDMLSISSTCDVRHHKHHTR